MLDIRKSSSLDHKIYKDSVTIREQVFVSEKSIPIEMEMQGENGPCYYVGYVNNVPVVTARVILNVDKWIIQRMAVILSERHKNYGSLILKKIENDAALNAINKIELNAQDEVKDFYINLGYEIIGKKFTEFHLPHYTFIKKINLQNYINDDILKSCDESRRVR